MSDVFVYVLCLRGCMCCLYVCLICVSVSVLFVVSDVYVCCDCVCCFAGLFCVCMCCFCKCDVLVSICVAFVVFLCVCSVSVCVTDDVFVELLFEHSNRCFCQLAFIIILSRSFKYAMEFVKMKKKSNFTSH